jgi:carbon monoxide dehydrogenase subunit G
MPTVSRTFTTTASPEVVFDYLADFTHTVEWDPPTVSCERVYGTGGVDTVYRNVTRFLRREVQTAYTAVELERPTRLHFSAHNNAFDGDDTITIRPSGTGSEVTYSAQFRFSGASRLLVPGAAAYLPFLATKTIEQMRGCLDRLA